MKTGFQRVLRFGARLCLACALAVLLSLAWLTVATFAVDERAPYFTLSLVVLGMSAGVGGILAVVSSWDRRWLSWGSAGLAYWGIVVPNWLNLVDRCGCRLPGDPAPPAPAPPWLLLGTAFLVALATCEGSARAVAWFRGRRTR